MFTQLGEKTHKFHLLPFLQVRWITFLYIVFYLSAIGKYEEQGK